MFKESDIKEFGFLNLEVDKDLDLPKEIQKLCEEKNAVILAHYYQTGNIQDIAPLYW
jgi:quinolinate synthase